VSETGFAGLATSTGMMHPAIDCIISRCTRSRLSCKCLKYIITNNITPDMFLHCNLQVLVSKGFIDD